MFRNLILLSAAVLTAATTGVQAQSFDTSGTAGLSGQYLFRYINLFNDTSGNVTEACSLTGVITFDGKGVYKLSNTTLYDSAGTPTGSCTSLGGGTYGVQSNGIAQLDNPTWNFTLYGTFSKPVITASSTEEDGFDLFIAVQAPTTPFSNGSLKGAYTVGSYEFPNASSAGNTLAHQAYFTLNADGNGNVAPFTLNGSAANLTQTQVTQSISGATYSLSGTTGGILTIPNSVTSQLAGGTKTLFVSADGGFVLGGSLTGADMIFGFQAPTSAASNSLLNGTYFASGMDASLGNTSTFLDAFYGSVNANGNGTLIWHQRFDDVVDIVTWDSVFSSKVTIPASGAYYDGTYTTLVGANGKAMMRIGSGSQMSINIGIQAPSYPATGSVWINPLGITNAANYTGITNAYAPGELVNIYGNFGVAAQADQAIPIPTVLGGVQVTVNGYQAPVYSVSPNQISALIPYGLATNNQGDIDYFATFQVIVNGTKSNKVTVYLDQTSPGLYTATQNGIGAAAVLHSNYTAVSSASPATPGETVSLFLNGLGTATPKVQDGAAGPTNPLSYADEFSTSDIFILLDDQIDTEAQGAVTFAGPAPGIPGLYQVNFTIPKKGLGNGPVYIDFNTLEAESYLATINLTGFNHNSSVTNDAPFHRPAFAKVKTGATAKTLNRKAARRALPVRTTAGN
jgi:uncharacterized protein (TIGR03437 family)